MRHALFETTLGNFIVELDDVKAPKTVKNFLDYLHKGHYDNTIFHRVINGFMIQGGGFTADMKQKPTDAPIDNEAQNGLKNDKYAIAMARTNDPHSATAQFFINVVNNDFLNHTAPVPQGWGYAVFGKVIEGLEVIDEIRLVKTSVRGFHQDVPVNDVVIACAYEYDLATRSPINQPQAQQEEVKAELVEIPAVIDFFKGAEIATHEVEGAASNLTITVGDEPGAGNANHKYVITGFDTGSNVSADHDEIAQSLTILFQNGVIPEVGNNGVTPEVLLAICAHRLQGFQAGPFPSPYNEEALDHINLALVALKSRTKQRVAKGIEGTHQA